MSLAGRKQALIDASKALSTDDPRNAIKTIIAIADSGDQTAIAVYARLLVSDRNKGFGQDLDLAEQLATDLAGRGHPLGNTLLGQIRIERGDVAGGLDDMRRAAASGHIHARVELAMYLVLHRRKDRTAATEIRGLLSSLSRDGNATASYLYTILDPLGGPNDLNAELRYREWLWRKFKFRSLEKLAIKGNTKAMIELARYYKRRGDMRTADKWFCMAGEEGRRASLWQLPCDR